jgi:plastocyanin
MYPALGEQMRRAWHLWIAFTLVLTGFTRSGRVPPAAAAAGPGPDAATVLVIRAFQFRPKSVEVPVGTRVVWSNEDEIEHTVTSGDGERSDVDRWR